MERLTKRELAEVKGKQIVLCNHKESDCNDSCMYRRCKWNEKALQKLKEYEDLEEQISNKFADCIDMKTILDAFCAFYDMQEIKEELAQCALLTNEEVLKYRQWKDAEEQGLLLRLPCKTVFESTGDVVYFIFDYEIVECVNCGISLNCEGTLWIDLACDDYIFPYREPIAGVDLDHTDWCMRTTCVKIEEWGKTVFLTKEEAEQALAELQGD